MATPDSYTTLLIHSDTTDGDTNIVDSSSNTHTITPNGNVHHETDQAKFGVTSIYFGNVETDYLNIPSHTDFNFGSGDFTIDTWVYLNSITTDGFLFYHWTDQTSNSEDFVYWYIRSNALMRFQYFIAGGPGGSDTSDSTGTVPTGEWVHLAIVKSSGTLTFYINGESSGSESFSAIPNQTNTLRIGCYRPVADGNGGPYGRIDGYIDEYRISKGIARWTSNFTPPQYPYASSVSNVQGTLNDSAEVIIIDESDWSIEAHSLESTGSYEIPTASGSKLVVARRVTDGEVISYGNVDSNTIEDTGN